MGWPCKQNASGRAFQANFICYNVREEVSWTTTDKIAWLYRESCLDRLRLRPSEMQSVQKVSAPNLDCPRVTLKKKPVK